MRLKPVDKRQTSFDSSLSAQPVSSDGVSLKINLTRLVAEAFALDQVIVRKDVFETF
jgi:hypothetical protein